MPSPTETTTAEFIFAVVARTISSQEIECTDRQGRRIWKSACGPTESVEKQVINLAVRNGCRITRAEQFGGGQFVRYWAVSLEYALKTAGLPDCPDCKNTRFYVGLHAREPCRSCCPDGH